MRYSIHAGSQYYANEKWFYLRKSHLEPCDTYILWPSFCVPWNGNLFEMAITSKCGCNWVRAVDISTLKLKIILGSVLHVFETAQLMCCHIIFSCVCVCFDIQQALPNEMLYNSCSIYSFSARHRYTFLFIYFESIAIHVPRPQQNKQPEIDKWGWKIYDEGRQRRIEIRLVTKRQKKWV